MAWNGGAELRKTPHFSDLQSFILAVKVFIRRCMCTRRGLSILGLVRLHRPGPKLSAIVDNRVNRWSKGHFQMLLKATEAVMKCVLRHPDLLPELEIESRPISWPQRLLPLEGSDSPAPLARYSLIEVVTHLDSAPLRSATYRSSDCPLCGERVSF